MATGRIMNFHERGDFRSGAESTRVAVRSLSFQLAGRNAFIWAYIWL
jgi:hypothetical protein